MIVNKMNVTTLRDLFGHVAVVATIFQFLSGAIVCKQYATNKTTAESSPLPFLFGVVSCCLWLLYGLTKHDNNIIVVNVIGFTLMISYLVVFYIYTFRKSSLLKQILFMTCFVIFIFGYVSVEDDNEVLIIRLGRLAASLTILTIGAPMSKLMYVIKVKSTECLPFPMILMSFFVCTLWALYAVLDEDYYLITPNGIGAILALVQLSLFVVYPRTPQTQSPIKSIIA